MGGHEKGRWAPNGCWEMEGLFTCLYRGVSRVVEHWVADVMVEVMGKGEDVKR